MSKRIPLGLKIIGTTKLVFAAMLAGVAMGAFKLIGDNIGEELEQFVVSLHLDPKKHIINDLLEKISGLDAHHLKQIGAATMVYSLLYVIEGVGLLRGKHWAEYMVIIITGSLMPLEMYEITQKVSLMRVAVLVLNTVMLTYLVWRLQNDKKADAARRKLLEVEAREHTPPMP